MLTLVMCQRQTNYGFTLLELLVTLVLVGLVSAIAIPAINNWLESRKAADFENTLSTYIALLPIKARTTGQPITLNENTDLASELNDELGKALAITSPVKVLANGYCVGGRVNITVAGYSKQYDVKEPFCELRVRASQ